MNSPRNVYLDFNATTPVLPEVLEVMLPYYTKNFGNPSSDHLFGWDVQESIDIAREQIGELLSCKPAEIFFTSGATEAANLAIVGFCKAQSSKGKHIITCKTEHNAILGPMKALERNGFTITFLDVDSEGNIDLSELENSITPETILVCLMLANNETGLLHPLKQIEKIVHSYDIKLMSDITQAVGKIPISLDDLNLDIAIFSSHKIYGPKGCGALFINRKNKIKVDPVIFGGGQEKGIRPGTPNVPGIVGFGKAAEVVSSQMKEEAVKIFNLRNKLEEQLEKIESSKVNAKNSARLPNTTNITFDHIDGTHLLRMLNKLSVSRGSACISSTLYPSHVLTAMGLNDCQALSSIRISLGNTTTRADIEFAAEEIRKVVSHLKNREV